MNPYEKMSMEEMEIVYQAYVKQNKINSFFQCYVERLKKLRYFKPSTWKNSMGATSQRACAVCRNRQ